MKKFLAFIVVALVAINLYGASEVTSGKCGDNLSWEYSDGVLTISGTGYMYNYNYRDKVPWIDIRDKIKSIVFDGKITSIGDYAFEDFTALTSITIPSSVTEIGGSAFSNCSGLTSITIPSSVTEIGGRAFSNCSGLTSITIPNSVTHIGRYAFSGCSGLTSITIPSSVTYIDRGAFSSCSGLASIKVASSNSYYDSRNNCNAIIERSTNELIAGCKNTIIPSSVTEIGDDAFYGCSGLTSITIPSSVTEIGDRAFGACSGLASIKVASSNSYYDSRNNCNAIIERSTNELIAGCKNTIIPSSVTEIGDDAFHGCFGLTSITIPNSVTEIGNSAFYFCPGLTSITIPSSVTEIGDDAFESCFGLTSITIPSSVTEIGYNAFCFCIKLSSVFVESVNPPKINSSFYSIADDAVLYVPYGSLKAYNVAPWNTFFSKIQEVKKCGDNLFCEYSKGVLTITGTGDMYDFDIDDDYISTAPWSEYSNEVESIVFDGEITSIGDYAFEDFTALTSVTIPNSVKRIGEYVFDGCTSLRLLKIGNGVTSIGEFAFARCSLLSSIIIPNSVTDINDYAFYYCEFLTSVKIGNGVRSIGDYAFYGCFSLTFVTCEAIEVPRLFSQTFGEVRVDKATLYVPVESLELYKNAYIWRDFYNILPIANTGVEDVFAPKTESETTKIFYKGNIYILRDGKVYTLMGEEVYDIPM